MLQETINILKKEYDLKDKRRKLHSKNSYNLNNYSEWELCEDEIDWNDYTNDYYTPNNPQFNAMTNCVQEHATKRHNQMKAAIKVCKSQS